MVPGDKPRDDSGENAEARQDVFEGECGLMSAARDFQPSQQEAVVIIQDCCDVARVELKRIALAIINDEKIRAELGQPAVDELEGGSYLLRRENKSVALRPGIAGELRARDLQKLIDQGVACPAIFVNIVECRVCITPYQTDLNLLREVAYQLGV